MLIATGSAVFRLDGSGGQIEPLQVYKNDNLLCIAQGRHNEIVGLRDGRIAIWTGTQVQHVDCGIGEPIESLLLLGEGPLDLLIGTQGAHLLRLQGSQCKRVASFDRLGARAAWHTPWGGPPSVRSLAANGDGVLYANVHVGDTIRSPDAGKTWKALAHSPHADVHQVATCPAAAKRVCANTARGVFVSDDLGRSWQHRGQGLGNRYGRAIAVYPNDGNIMLASVSDGPTGPDVHAALYWTEDGGQTWKHITERFPASAPRNIDTHQVVYTVEGVPWAAAGQMLYLGRDRGSRWGMFWRAPEPIRMITVPSARELAAVASEAESAT